MSGIDFTGKVAIVTGAGSGLGRSHAIDLARRGAKVVINDLGGNLRGAGKTSEAALAVAREIEAAGGVAIGDSGSVTDQAAMNAMVARATAAFGRVDMLVANAGFIRDMTFAKMSPKDFDAVVAVHLLGTARVTKAVWNIMREQSFGRIVFTTSGSGLYGGFGQSNYDAGKMGIVGLMNALKLEGAKFNIKVNTIAPVAVTRMSDGVFPEEIARKIQPEHVSAGVSFLLSDDAPNGVILNAGGGLFSVSRVVESIGVKLGLEGLGAEQVRDSWAKIADPAGERYFAAAAEAGAAMMARI